MFPSFCPIPTDCCHGSFKEKKMKLKEIKLEFSYFQAFILHKKQPFSIIMKLTVELFYNCKKMHNHFLVRENIFKRLHGNDAMKVSKGAFEFLKMKCILIIVLK